MLGSQSLWKWLFSFLTVMGFSFVALWALDFLWWRPKRVERHFAKQGIRGPPYRFFLGNVQEMVRLMLEASSKPIPMAPPYSHNILPRVLSFYHQWRKLYGTTLPLFSYSPRASALHYSRSIPLHFLEFSALRCSSSALFFVCFSVCLVSTRRLL